jgi:hypothetical protein
MGPGPEGVFVLALEPPALEPPAFEVVGPCNRGDAAYLIKRQAITILPSVPSLKALRFSARMDAGAKPLIGFGDPVLRADFTVSAASVLKGYLLKDFKCSDDPWD